jgi:ATP-dependent protease HslVU (ClpYQ) peptidase subunit
MTCIVGLVHKKVVYIGSDCLGSSADIQIPRIDAKIFKLCDRNDALIGFAGSYRVGQLLQYAKCLITPKVPCTHKGIVTKTLPKIYDIFDNAGLIKKNKLMSGEDSFLLAYKSKLFQIDVDFQVAESLRQYDAIGSGSSFALGSLYSTEGMQDPIQRVYLALKSASVFGVSIGPPFHIINTKDNTEMVFEI